MPPTYLYVSGPFYYILEDESFRSEPPTYFYVRGLFPILTIDFIPFCEQAIITLGVIWHQYCIDLYLKTSVISGPITQVPITQYHDLIFIDMRRTDILTTSNLSKYYVQISWDRHIYVQCNNVDTMIHINSFIIFKTGQWVNRVY